MGRCKNCKCFIVRCLRGERCKRCARLREAEDQKDLERVRNEGSVSHKTENEGSVPATTSEENATILVEGVVTSVKLVAVSSTQEAAAVSAAKEEITVNVVKEEATANVVKEEATANVVKEEATVRAVNAVKEGAVASAVQEAAAICGVNEDTIKASAVKQEAAGLEQATAQSREDQTSKPRNVREIFDRFVDPTIAGLSVLGRRNNEPQRTGVLADDSDLSSDDDDDYEIVTGVDGRSVKVPSAIGGEYEVFCAKTTICLHRWGFGPEDMLGYLRATRLHDPIKHYGSSTSKGSSNEAQDPHFMRLQMLHRMKSVVRLMEWGFTMEQMVEYLELTTA